MSFLFLIPCELVAVLVVPVQSFSLFSKSVDGVEEGGEEDILVYIRPGEDTVRSCVVDDEV